MTDPTARAMIGELQIMVEQLRDRVRVLESALGTVTIHLASDLATDGPQTRRERAIAAMRSAMGAK